MDSSGSGVERSGREAKDQSEVAQTLLYRLRSSVTLSNGQGSPRQQRQITSHPASYQDISDHVSSGSEARLIQGRLCDASLPLSLN